MRHVPGFDQGWRGYNYKKKTLDPFSDWIPDYKRRGQASRMTEGEKAGMMEEKRERE